MNVCNLELASDSEVYYNLKIFLSCLQAAMYKNKLLLSENKLKKILVFNKNIKTKN